MGGVGTCRMSLWPLHCVVCVDEGVVAHVCARKVFSRKVCYTFIGLIMACCDEASVFVIKGMKNLEVGVGAVIVFG